MNKRNFLVKLIILIDLRIFTPDLPEGRAKAGEAGQFASDLLILKKLEVDTKSRSEKILTMTVIRQDSNLKLNYLIRNY